MTLVVFQFLISAALIVVAGSFLTKFADQIAESTGWGKVFIGGLFLAGATSLPELSVDLKAIEMNLPDLAVGDLLGSSLFNLLVLALLDFSFPSAFRRTSFSPVFLHHAISAVLAILLTSIVGVGIVSKIEYSIFGVSLFFWSVLFFYVFGLRLIFRQNEKEEQANARFEPTTSNSKSRKVTLMKAFAGYFASAAAIVAVAPFLVEAADELAKLSGLGHTFIGTTLVALSTSLPELVATLKAFRMGAPDLALGNIFGSNAFNMILFLPLDYFYSGPLLSSIRISHAATAFGVVATMSIAVMGQLYRKNQRSLFSEPSSEIVVLVSLLILFVLHQTNSP